jgi:hypothetical protein
MDSRKEEAVYVEKKYMRFLHHKDAQKGGSEGDNV